MPTTERGQKEADKRGVGLGKQVGLLFADVLYGKPNISSR